MDNRYARSLMVAVFPSVLFWAISTGDLLTGGVIVGVYLAASAFVLAANLPGLNRLPVVGGAQLEVRFRANSSPARSSGETVLGVETNDDLPQTIIVETEVQNASNRIAREIMVNIGGTAGYGHRCCTPWGEPQPKGEPLLPKHGVDATAYPPFNLTPGDNALFYFRFDARNTASFKAMAEISSPDLYENLTPHVSIRFEECRPCLRDRLGPIIDEAVWIAAQSWDGDSACDRLREAVATLNSQAHQLLFEASNLDLLDHFRGAEADRIGARRGINYWRAVAEAKSKALMEIRDQLGREEEALEGIEVVSNPA